jgi:hypothetical protein
MIKKIPILIFLGLSSLLATAQEEHLKVISRPVDDSIILRWAPMDYDHWVMGNRYGYTVVRYTLFRSGQLLENPEESLLTTLPLKPLPLADWESIVESDTAAAVAAQAIYGEKFEMDTGSGSSGTDGTVPMSIYQQSTEREMRYSSALYVADISPITAKASGLMFTDKSISKNEEYLYRVFLSLPDSLAAVGDTAVVLTGTKYAVTLPAPVEFGVEWGDKQATLSWNSYALNDTYIAYEAQRSVNGKEYTGITDKLSVLMYGDESVQELSFMIDSLPDNGNEYFYRIRGISSFGERGPWSVPVSGKGKDAVSEVPAIQGYEITPKGLSLSWSFPEEMEDEIVGFRIYRSGSNNSGFEEIGLVKPSLRSFTDDGYKPTNYYIVEAYNSIGSATSSFPLLAQTEDNEPPLMPVGVSGVADTSWIVTLRWKENPEEDMLGYIIFRSVSGRDEYNRLTPSPINRLVFTDTLNKKDLNKEVYYRVAAVDKRQNISALSAPSAIVKPDIIPPNRPVIRNVTSTTEGPRIVFDKSNDSDVAVHEIYRQVKGDTLWSLLSAQPSDVNNGQALLTDGGAPENVALVYKVTAIDYSGNRSDSPPSVAIKTMSISKRENVSKISGKIDRENGKVLLEWDFAEENPEMIMIYRRTSKNEYSIYQTLEGESLAFGDSGLKVGEEYGYRIKLSFADGSVSGFSNEILIGY